MNEGNYFCGDGPIYEQYSEVESTIHDTIRLLDTVYQELLCRKYMPSALNRFGVGGHMAIST